MKIPEGWIELIIKDCSGEEYKVWRYIQYVDVWVDGEKREAQVKTETDVMLIRAARMGAMRFLENEKRCMLHVLLEWILEENKGKEIKCPFFDLDTTRKIGVHTETRAERFGKIMGELIGMLDD